MYDCYGDVDRVPELLARAEREDEAAAWDELGYRLTLECDLVFPASFAALPRLVRLASGSARARGPAGAIVRCNRLLDRAVMRRMRNEAACSAVSSSRSVVMAWPDGGLEVVVLGQASVVVALRIHAHLRPRKKARTRTAVDAVFGGLRVGCGRGDREV